MFYWVCVTSSSLFLTIRSLPLYFRYHTEQWRSLRFHKSGLKEGGSVLDFPSVISLFFAINPVSGLFLSCRFLSVRPSKRGTPRAFFFFFPLSSPVKEEKEGQQRREEQPLAALRDKKKKVFVVLLLLLLFLSSSFSAPSSFIQRLAAAQISEELDGRRPLADYYTLCE